MKRPSIYVKMKVLGAIDIAPGKTQHERIQNAAAMTFTDEEGKPHSFTWRTIQTWHYRYKNHGITAMDSRPRSDKGGTRKVTPEEVLEAINAALPHFVSTKKGHGKTPSKTAIYRFCIEKGLLNPNQIASRTFSRMVGKYELLAQDASENKRRLAFSMQYANQLWQADTCYWPRLGRTSGMFWAELLSSLRTIVTPLIRHTLSPPRNQHLAPAFQQKFIVPRLYPALFLRDHFSRATMPATLFRSLGFLPQSGCDCVSADLQ
jgi:hypothetical protein